MTIKNYTELLSYSSFVDRYDYLRLGGTVGEETFGFDRYLNQALYRSTEWQKIRDKVIIRDAGCDLAISGMEIRDRIIIHHMNPITVNDVRRRNKVVFDPEFLICVSPNTHLAIHYSDERKLKRQYIERSEGDTCLWRRQNE